MAIVNAQLETTQLNVIEVPEGKSWAITNILVCNNDAVNSAAFDLHLIQNTNGNPGALNNAVTRVINNLELPAGETFTFDSERIILEAGDRVAFVAEPDTGGGLTDLSATVSYMEV